MNIIDDIYNHFKDRERVFKGTMKPEGFYVGPSYLSDCQRKIYYKKTNEGESNPITLPSYFKMEMGTKGHELLQDILLKRYPDAEVEKEFVYTFSGITFYGFIDLIIDKKVIEIKTVYGRAFSFIENEPKPDHLLQALTYCASTGLKEAIILYVGRDNGYMIQHKIEIKDDIFINGNKHETAKNEWLMAIKRMKNVENSVKTASLPDRDFSCIVHNGVFKKSIQRDKIQYKSDWHCEYCQYRDTCYNDISSQDGIWLGNKKIGEK